MAKSRTNRRPSTSPSFSSTLTTLFFIVIAVFCVWMLTSKNADPPQTHTTTTRTAIDNSATNNFFSSSDDSAETTTTSHDQKDTPVYRDNPGYLPDDAIESDEKNPNAHFNKDLQKGQSSATEAQLSEESTLTQRQEASETNEAGADNYHQLADKKMSESERVQRSSIGEASEGYQKDEEENARVQDANPHGVNVGENHEPNAGRQQEDVSNFDNQESKNDDDELNKKQLRKDKGEVSEEDQKQEEDVSNFDNQESKNDGDELNKKQLRGDKGEVSEEDQKQQEDASNFDNQESKNDGDELNKKQLREDKGEVSEEDQKQEEDVSNFDNQESKNDDDELNKKQLREDKGEVSEEDQKQQDQQEKQDENSKTSKQELEGESSQLTQTEFEEKEAHKPEQQKQDESSNSYSDSDTHTTSEASQLKHEGESSQLNQTEFEETEAQKAEQQKQDESSNSYSDSDTHNTSEASQLKHEGESSQLTQTEPEENETQRPESVKKKTGSKKSWSTQADQSQQQQERQNDESDSTESTQDNTWHLCNVTAGADYIPCLDNVKALKQLRTTKHYEHRERHCPEDAPSCLVPLPKGYKRPIEWPASRDKIWYYNVPHTLLAEVKGHQNWVKRTGEFLTFPGGGTQFIHGALHYIDFIQLAEPAIAWGKRTRVILDVGCGVGSFGGYLFERDVIAMSFAPKDEHVAQVQFALERGIPSISAVMGSQRLPFPSMVFDLVHCARCRVPWHAEGGKLLLELNRVLRPGGYFVWSATPVYQKLEEDIQIWNEMSSLTKSMCWELVTINKDKLNNVGVAIYRKPLSNECYERREENSPPICNDNDDPNAAWYVPLQACLHKVPVEKDERGTKWPKAWPNRLHKTPYWLNDLQVGIYGKPASQDFAEDTERWKNIVDEMSNIGITWSNVRNVMDMRAVYGGFAAALRDLPVWVFNVVNVDAPDTLPIIYERGLFGIYHDWCESFSTYPRTYDLLHADGLFSKLKKRCKLVPVIAEVDRIVRPGGKLIVRDDSNTLGEVEKLLKSLHWEITSKYQESLLCAKKGKWRPDSYVAVS